MKSIEIILFYFYITSWVYSSKFKLGLLTPERHVRLGFDITASAATDALRDAQSAGILSNHNISILYRNDLCSPVNGSGQTVAYFEEDLVDVLIGSPCSACKSGMKFSIKY